MAKKLPAPKTIADLTHSEATRKNIPTIEHQAVMSADERAPKTVTYPRGSTALSEEKTARNPDIDPQLIWRGKLAQDEGDLQVNTPPLYIQEKVKPKALIDDLKRHSQQQLEPPAQAGFDFFGDFNGLPEGAERTDFYQHDGHWQNRMILGDSLQVMASLAEREGLRGQVQCIYFDPPYGIKFNSNFQWSTTSRNVTDGSTSHITREPEQVKAFRDTWRDGIHSYLTYLRDRLMVARDLLSESGSIFVQIGDENVHRVRCLIDEVFNEGNFVSQIAFRTTTGNYGSTLASASNYLLWYARNKERLKYRALYQDKAGGASTEDVYSLMRFDDGHNQRLSAEQRKGIAALPENARQFRIDNLTSTRSAGASDVQRFSFQGKGYSPGKGTFKSDEKGLSNLAKAGRISSTKNNIYYVRYIDDFPAIPFSNVWTDTNTGGNLSDPKVYVVQTATKVIQRCILMATDPGDLILDPTCGSGTSAYVAEQWGRRWITIDTSRVALALARARIMGARYPYYLLADSEEGQAKEAELSQSLPSTQSTYGNLNHGFVCQRVPHITLKSIANNEQIDVIWEKHQQTLEPLRKQLNALLKKDWQEWDIPRQADAKWSAETQNIHAAWWQARIARQQEIDASIAARAEYETLYDKPYEDKKRVRVAGSFTVESLSPHRTPGVDEAGDLIDPGARERSASGQDFTGMILESLKTAGVQQKDKQGRIAFSALTPWPGTLICAEGSYLENHGEGEQPKRAAILIGPEFSTVSRADLVDAAREAADADFDVLIACAFNFDAAASEFSRLGRIHILKARMNADLHMAEDLKNTGHGNLFVIFGEPDIEVRSSQGHNLLHFDGSRETVRLPEGEAIIVKIRGIDIFDPASGHIRSDDPDGIACWLLDTDYNGESFFVRHAYFLGANDPYKALKTTLKADIDESAWASLNSDTSRPFAKPGTGRFAVKVINHLGDEVMKVFRVA